MWKISVAVMFASFAFTISPWYALPALCWAAWATIEQAKQDSDEE